MSALDDVIEWAKETQHEDITEAERAREELGLLREEAFECVSRLHLDHYSHSCSCGWSTTKAFAHKADHKCPHADTLRTDPERAKRMGLGWAL